MKFLKKYGFTVSLYLNVLLCSLLPFKYIDSYVKFILPHQVYEWIQPQPVYAQNQYVFSVTQNKTLCTANQVNNGGTIELQMRCYDTTVANPSYRLLLNTSITDSVFTKAGDITCLFSFNDPTRTSINASCAGDVKDVNGNITGENLLLNTTFTLP